jgi:hypothetical protein
MIRRTLLTLLLITAAAPAIIPAAACAGEWRAYVAETEKDKPYNKTYGPFHSARACRSALREHIAPEIYNWWCASGCEGGIVNQTCAQVVFCKKANGDCQIVLNPFTKKAE